MLSLNTRAHSAVRDIRNAIGDDRSVIKKRDIGDGGDNPANAVEVLRDHHTRNDAVVALGILDLESVLQHEARGRDGQGEAQCDLHTGTELRAVGFAAGATARHSTPATLVPRPVAVEHSASLLEGHQTWTPHRVTAVRGRLHGRPH